MSSSATSTSSQSVSCMGVDSIQTSLKLLFPLQHDGCRLCLWSQVFICLSPRTLYPSPPPHTLYTYSHREGGGGRAEPERRIEGATAHKAGSKIPPPVYKHLPQSPFTGKFFLDDEILLWRLYTSLVFMTYSFFHRTSINIEDNNFLQALELVNLHFSIS
jgi:hypothetical protein